MALPAGSEWATAADSGLRFAVPDTWEPIDAAALASGESNAAVDQLLETMGVTQEEFVQSMAGMELMVMGPAESNFAPNVNVVPNALSELPPAENLASELSSIGATTGTPSDETTPLGPAILVPYSLQERRARHQGPLDRHRWPQRIRHDHRLPRRRQGCGCRGRHRAVDPQRHLTSRAPGAVRRTGQTPRGRPVRVSS